MILHRYQSNQAGSRGGFTMIEIALSLAIVGFALVAIIGVLPTGMTVQKDNREDTLMGQEGRYWMEAIRMGAGGLRELTNYVEEIKVVRVNPNPSLNETFYYSHALDKTNFTSDLILRLLTQPKYDRPFPTNVYTEVTARIKPITGNASDLQVMVDDPSTNSIGFRYEMQCEVVPEVAIPVQALDQLDPAAYQQARKVRGNLGNNLNNVRLVFRYPVRPRGNEWVAGNGQKAFHAKIAGSRDPVSNLPTPNRFPTLVSQ